MEIRSGQLLNQYQQNIKTQPKQEQDSSAGTVVSSSDTLSISSEAQVLFGEGGGHPDRPKKEN